ncbi:hypothetical protein ACTFQO_09510 [Bacillus cereus group sp. MYBK29-1]|nr:hypothetical protein [Bacillus cereus group sp. TH228LC]MDA1576970.1 hypothetical protein [Bacillus cereus group sp. TH228LC]
MGSKRLNNLHPLDDNNTQEALDGFVKSSRKSLGRRERKTKETK